MTSLIDRLVRALAERINRELEPYLSSSRAMARGLVDDTDDRMRLFRLELRDETGRLTRLALYGAASVICAIGSLLWVCAGVVLLAWSTEYRTHAILAVVAVWILATAFSIGMARSLARRRRHAFRLSRELLGNDVELARQWLRERR